MAEYRTRELKANREAIGALNLPSYSGNTTAAAGAGQMESAMLSTDAIGMAAQRIAGLPALASGPILILSAGETVDADALENLKARLDMADAAVTAARPSVGSTLLDSALNQIMAAPGGTSSMSVIAPGVQVATAVLGMVSSSTDVASVGAYELNTRLLTTAVAARLGGRARVPSMMIGRAAVVRNSVDARLRALAVRRLSLREQAGALPEQGRGAGPKARLNAAAQDVDDLIKFATTADATGVTPLSRALRAER